MPLFVTAAEAAPQALAARTSSLESAAALEMVGRGCHLEKYKKLTGITDFKISGTLIAYASPDSTYAVTKQLLDAAKHEIVIGIYDFSAAYMKQLILHAMQRGVKVSLMLDIDNDGEKKLFRELKKFGCKTVQAPSCASDTISYFPSSHEKVIVIDGHWVLVQSGNWSENSIPLNEEDGGDPDHFVKGNRDMGVAIDSKPLAAFFAKVLRRDMKLELDAEGVEMVARRAPAVAEPELVEAVPKLLPTKLFPSKTFKLSKVSVQPVLTPDNYLDIVSKLVADASKSIVIEQQYIRSEQPQIVRLLTAIDAARAKNPKLDVRIILGKLFGTKDFVKEQKNVKNIKAKHKLVLGKNIRYIDTKRFVHCHNKLIVVDDKRASSAPKTGLARASTPIGRPGSSSSIRAWQLTFRASSSPIGARRCSRFPSRARQRSRLNR